MSEKGCVSELMWVDDDRRPYFAVLSGHEVCIEHCYELADKVKCYTVRRSSRRTEAPPGAMEPSFGGLEGPAKLLRTTLNRSRTLDSAVWENLVAHAVRRWRGYEKPTSILKPTV